MSHAQPPLSHLAKQFRGKRLLIVGDVILDEFIWGEARRISPEAPVPIVRLKSRTYLPGGAGNTAANVVSLGGSARLGGVVGHDENALRVRNVLESFGVNADGLAVDTARPTTTKTRIHAHNHQIVRVDAEEKTLLSPPLETELVSWAQAHLDAVDGIIISDYAKGVVTPSLAQSLIHSAREKGYPVIVDPKGTDYTKYRGATIITPNVYELGEVCRREIEDESDLIRASQELCRQLDGTSILATRGAEGMLLFQAGAPPLQIPATARQVFDVTGAGDTVVSAFALALATGAGLAAAAQLANLAAGIAVGKVGTATVSLEELLTNLHEGNA